MTNSSPIRDVLFFPQMKPEKKPIELTEEEKAVLALLKAKSPVALAELKEQSGLSNKNGMFRLKDLPRINWQL